MHIKFKSNDASIPSSEKQVISNLNSVVSGFSSSRIFIIGHTDSSGPADKNQELSYARADSIYKSLMDLNFTNLKVLVKGMGESEPIADNNTIEGRSKNRRVLVVLAGLDAEKVMALKAKLANTEGMEVLDKETSAVTNFITITNEAADKAEAVNVGEPVIEESQREVAASVVGAAHSNKMKYRYSAASGAYYNFLEAEDRDNSRAKAQWVSELNVPVGGFLQYNFSKFWLGLKLFGHIQDYKIEKNPDYIWDEETPFLLRGSLISDFETDRFGFGFDLDFNQELFIFETADNISLENEFFIGLSVRAKYKWFISKHWSSRIGTVISYPLLVSSEIESKGELGYIVELDLKKENFLKNHGLTTKLYYGFRNFSNMQNDQKEEVLGLTLSLDSSLWL